MARKVPDDEVRRYLGGGMPPSRDRIEMVEPVEISKTDGQDGHPVAIFLELDQVAGFEFGWQREEIQQTITVGERLVRVCAFSFIQCQLVEMASPCEQVARTACATVVGG